LNIEFHLLYLLYRKDLISLSSKDKYSFDGSQRAERGLELLGMLKEDSEKLAAADVHELQHAWENTRRMRIAEGHLRHVLFREEIRRPGYYHRAGYPDMDEANRECFVNSIYDPSPASGF
jgi:succinate dehydrogenase/fumarate reductase flavoprotein subunit